ncbi:acireductone synthase [Streptomyces sp. NPDC127106]|uniref:acireductone synthase n=1 Tax=Streptomyces sp. NPDC127106 TaxID=3345360 RepID=UPI00362AFC6C
MNRAGPPVLALVLDIEGTTGPLSHVADVLYPYARQRYARWAAAHRDEPVHREVLGAIAGLTGEEAVDEARAVAVLEEWTDHDVKTAPLKRVQAMIWARGYAAGELAGVVYPDVVGVLRRCRAGGVPVHIYSSGAVSAQRDWFAHSDRGDLTGLIAGYFDLDSAGPKRDPASYRAITGALRVPAGTVLFASDVAQELDAAAEAGWQTLGVRRPGDIRGPGVPGHSTVSALDRLLPDLGSTAAAPAPDPHE